MILEFKENGDLIEAYLFSDDKRINKTKYKFINKNVLDLGGEYLFIIRKHSNNEMEFLRPPIDCSKIEKDSSHIDCGESINVIYTYRFKRIKDN